MGFWLATLNPGKPYRATRRRGGRRLTKWQQAVRTHGGVKQAVAARRAGKLGGKRRRTRGGRKSSLWSRLVKKFGVMGALKHRGKQRRSAVSRRSLRSRSRKHITRRSAMAKTRRRRTPPRGAGGRFKSRRSRRGGRRRRNPVVPVSWNPKRRKSSRRRRNPVLPISWNPSRRRRSSRRRRNPLFLSRRGFAARKHSGYRQLHRRRRAPHRWHNNPYLHMNPKRRRRSYRRNGVLPISWNPVAAGGDIMSRVKQVVDISFWTETGLPVSVGFFGSKIVGGQVYGLVFSSGTTPLASYVPIAAIPFVRAAVNAASGAAMAWAAGKVMSKKVADNIWLGTVVGVASDLIRQLLMAYAPSVAASIGLSGLGADLTEAMKQNIAKRIQGGVNGLGTYLTRERLQNNLAEYVTDRSLRNNAAYAPGPGGSLRSDLADYDHTNSDTTF